MTTPNGIKLGYARVSTQGQDLTLQLEKLKAAGCRRVFSGKRSGASKENEIALAELVEYCREGDTVVVTKLDRIGRSLNQVLNTIQTLKDKGVFLEVLDQNIDTASNDPLAVAFTQLLGVFAELERNFIVTRCKEGKDAARAAGKQVDGGRPTKYTDEDRTAVQLLRANGMTIPQIVQETGISRSAVYRLLK